MQLLENGLLTLDAAQHSCDSSFKGLYYFEYHKRVTPINILNLVNIVYALLEITLSKRELRGEI